MRLSVLLKLMLGFGLFLCAGLGVVGFNAFTKASAPEPNSPREAAERFVEDLAAHQYEVAVGSLTSNLSQEVSVQDLESLAMVIDSHQMGIRRVTGSDAQMRNGAFTVRVTVEFNSGLERFLDLPLSNEDGVWKVASIDPLWRVLLSSPEVEFLNG